jgi:hypothetical protein
MGARAYRGTQWVRPKFASSRSREHPCGGSQALFPRTEFWNAAQAPNRSPRGSGSRRSMSTGPSIASLRVRSSLAARLCSSSAKDLPVDAVHRQGSLLPRFRARVVLKDPRAMSALAQESRLALHDAFRRCAPRPSPTSRMFCAHSRKRCVSTWRRWKTCAWSSAASRGSRVRRRSGLDRQRHLR